MQFNSPTYPARAIIRRTDSGCRNTYGTPRRRRNTYGTPRRRKLSTPTVSPFMSPKTLTFLSPQPVFAAKRKRVLGSPRISDIRNCNSGLVNKETMAEPARKHNQQQTSPNSILFDNTPSAKSHCSGMDGWLMLDQQHQSGGTKRKSSDEDGVIGGLTLDFPQSVQKRRKRKILTTSPSHNMQQLEKTYRMIDRWQQEMCKLQTKDWEYKRKYWIEQCHDALWSVLTNSAMLETPGSEMFPKILLPITLLTEADKHWLNVLVNSARVERIGCPEFAELTHDPQNKTKLMEEEFEFQIQFQFGFDIKDLEWCIHSGVGKKGLNHHICSVIAEFVGRSKFICDVQIYYKKSASPWWEQDGIAKMRYWSDGKYIDMIDFHSEEEVYFAQEWPVNNLVIDDYNELAISELEEENSHIVMERKFISAVCCQIIHVCVCKTPAPQSCAARNVLKQVSMILKGWFIGVLIGEGITPDKVTFEYDTRAPCLAPVTN